MKKNTKGLLAKILFEQENVIAPSQTDPVVVQKNISLDQKVDKYIISYEKESIPTEQDYDIPGSPPIVAGPPPSMGTSVGPGEMGQDMFPVVKTRVQGESINRRNKGGILSQLFEAEGDDPTTSPDATGGDTDATGGDATDLGGGDTGNEAPVDTTTSTAPVIDTPKINLNHFGMGIARLINNYESLLNPKVTILGRAIEYIRVNYDEPTSKQFQEMMEQNFDLRLEEPERDQRMAPFAAGALVGDSGGGGAV